MEIFKSKKFITTIIGLICMVAAAKGLNIDPKIQEVLIQAIGIAIGGYNIGQGVADGFSGGATSGVASIPVSKDVG